MLHHIPDWIAMNWGENALPTTPTDQILNYISLFPIVSNQILIKIAVY